MNNQPDNTDISQCSREELEATYQLSQWALTWAIIKLGGKLEITPEDMESFNKVGQIYYGSIPTELGAITTVEFRELDNNPKLILLS